MGIPDYQTLMLPLLKHTADGQEQSFHSLVESLAADFKLTNTERRELLPSSGQFVFDNRVGWARTYMKKAGLLSAPKRGVVQITERGLEALAAHPKRIDNKALRQYPEFLEFQGAKTSDAKQEPEVGVPDQLDPQESMEAGHQRIRKHFRLSCWRESSRAHRISSNGWSWSFC